jgi:quinol-cytochrome oxidoreductase complex cytochrome b subunit
MATRAGRNVFGVLSRYSSFVLVPYFRATSAFGFALLANLASQFISGVLLALYYVPDPSMVMTFREEYANEVWWFTYVHKAHVVGVDSIFVLSYLHIFKKIYLKNYAGADVDGWVTGAYAFVVYHGVVFLGITLSSNHLGDVTVTIGANIFWSLLGSAHKAYAPLFTNSHLNVDQLTRFMVAHYVVAWYYAYLVQVHVVFIHEAWDPDSGTSAPQDSAAPKMAWLLDGLQREAALTCTLYVFFMGHFTRTGHPDARVISFSFFEQWGEAESEDINYFVVAPHWYFRAHMGLLTVCAQHYEGLAWLVGFYPLLALTPLWSRLSGGAPTLADTIPMRSSIVQQSLFVALAASVWYVAGTLPCGRFFYEGVEGFFGNAFLRASYQFVYAYLAFVAHAADRVERAVLALPAFSRFFRRPDRPSAAPATRPFWY